MLAMSRKIAWPKPMIFDYWCAKFHLSPELSSNITQFCSRLNTSPFHFHLADFQALLFRYSNHEVRDLCMGVGDGNRKAADVLRSIETFLSILYRSELQQSIQDSKEVSNNVFNNSCISLDAILDLLDGPSKALAALCSRLS
ncbi:hypothetical protein GGR56DRAFT_661840 [Xylariaceae sp. FL0804]|nr:hypothetical protein GGR56DRAFT_661840 [Xylariaceae sp. FL0804]